LPFREKRERENVVPDFLKRTHPKLLGGGQLSSWVEEKRKRCTTYMEFGEKKKIGFPSQASLPGQCKEEKERRNKVKEGEKSAGMKD